VTDSALARFDPNVPSIARVYDYWLGGKSNFAADRELAERMLAIAPGIAGGIRDNRAFIGRAVTWAAEQGITRFVDLGAGLPTSPNVHETVFAVHENARVTYVDNDPVVISHARALLVEGDQRIVVTPGDLREPAAIMAVVPDLASRSGPVALICALALHFFDADTATELIGQYIEMLPSGSRVILSIGRGIGQTRDRMNSTYNAASLYSHSPEDFAGFFGGLDLLPPGVSEAATWRPGWPQQPLPERTDGQVLVGVGLVRLPRTASPERRHDVPELSGPVARRLLCCVAARTMPGRRHCGGDFPHAGRHRL
jgi:hypothetical protein